jgi:hypothetical protein
MEVAGPRQKVDRIGVQGARPLDLFDATQGLMPVAPALTTAPILQGVSGARGRERALLSFAGAPAVWMKPGDVVEGWTFKGLRGQEVLLTSSNGQLALRPFSADQRGVQ